MDVLAMAKNQTDEIFELGKPSTEWKVLKGKEQRKETDAMDG